MNPGRTRSRLLVIWGLLAVMIAVIVVVQTAGDAGSRPSDHDDAHVSEGIRWLLPAPIDQIGAIEIVHQGVLHRFERDSAGAWIYHRPHGVEGVHHHRADPTTAQTIEKALAGFGRARIERTFPIEAAIGVIPLQNTQVRDYGVTVPSILVLVYASGGLQPWVQYAIGDVAPDGYSRYVLPVGSRMVATIANYQVSNLLDLIAAVASAGR